MRIAAGLLLDKSVANFVANFSVHKMFSWSKLFNSFSLLWFILAYFLQILKVKTQKNHEKGLLVVITAVQYW